MSSNVADHVRNTRYLGREFLTWLWFRSDKQEGHVKVSDDVTAMIWFVDKIVLSGSGDDAERVVIRTVEPSTNKEARVALRWGKQVEQARLNVVLGQREWSITISGDELSLSGIKIPAILNKEEDDQLAERFHLLDQIDGMMSAVFRRFVALRTGPDWEAERGMLLDWVKSIDN